jgi:hypothetical protein
MARTQCDRFTDLENLLLSIGFAFPFLIRRFMLSFAVLLVYGVSSVIKTKTKNVRWNFWPGWMDLAILK